jgi:hypothetical protein
MSLRDQLEADTKAICISANDFGEAAVYKPTGGGAPISMVGIWREPNDSATILGQGVSSTKPTFQVSRLDIPPVKTGDKISIPKRSVTDFYVSTGETKSNGTIYLHLSNDPS